MNPAKRVPHSPVIFSPVKSSSSQTSANLLENEDEQEECYKCSAEDVAPGRGVRVNCKMVAFDTFMNKLALLIQLTSI